MTNPMDSDDYDEVDSGPRMHSIENEKSDSTRVMNLEKQQPEATEADVNEAALETSTRTCSTREYFKQAFEAADQNDWKRIEKILQDCPSVIDEATEDGETLLHLAAWWNYTQLVDLLRRQSADHWPEFIERKNNRGLTALHIAALEGYIGITELLLTDQAAIMAQTRAGQTPLHFAVLWGHAAVAELLVAGGAQKNAKDNREKTPLYMATIKKDAPILKILETCA